MTNQDEAITTIYIELTKKDINSMLETMSDAGKMLNSVEYNLNELNARFKDSIDSMTKTLQAVVDEMYCGYYLVDSFIPFSKEDNEYAISHNSSLLNSMMKLLKFVE